MAIYHLHLKVFRRSQGAIHATAAAAYRTGETIHDERTGLTWSYKTREERIQDTQLILPKGAPNKYQDRAVFWSALEVHHKRHDATPFYELEVALPHDATEEDRKRMARELGQVISDELGVAVDVSVHTSEGGGDNWHAHLQISACRVGPDGFGLKQYELDPIWCGRNKKLNMADRFRPFWEDRVNEALIKAKSTERVSHKTLEAQGIDRPPQKHRGPMTREQRRVVRELKRIEKEIAEVTQLIKEESEQVISPEKSAQSLSRENMKKLARTGVKYQGGEELEIIRYLSASALENHQKNGNFFTAGIGTGVQEAMFHRDLRVAAEAAKQDYLKSKTEFDRGRWSGLLAVAEQMEALREQELPAPEQDPEPVRPDERKGRDDGIGY